MVAAPAVTSLLHADTRGPADLQVQQQQVIQLLQQQNIVVEPETIQAAQEVCTHFGVCGAHMALWSTN